MDDKDPYGTIAAAQNGVRVDGGPDQAKLMSAVRELGPKDRAILVVIQDADNLEDGPSYSLQEYRLSNWWQMLGALAVGQAYAQSEMFQGASEQEER